MKRRHLLQGTGAVTVLVAGGGAWVARERGVWSAGTGEAYEPWTSWHSEAPKGALALVRAAILASNPHNTQPWLFHVTDSSVELYADMSRHLGAFDAYRREMFLGLGCALENMMLAAWAAGFLPELTLAEGSLNPPPTEAEPFLAARIDLLPAQPATSDLHEAIPRRHTNRGPYDLERSVPAALAEALQATDRDEPGVRVVLITEPDNRARFGALIVEATEAIIADETMVHDSERWYRHARSEVDTYRDGPTLDAAGLPPLRLAAAKLLPRPSPETNHAYWLDNTREIQVPTAPVLGMIVVQDLYDIGQTLRAGRLWQRKHLWATTQGLAMQPLNQPVELVDRQRALGRHPAMAAALTRHTGDVAGKPTFAFRAGYPRQAAPPSPRRALDDVLL